MTSYSSLINQNNISFGFQGIERDPSGITDVIKSAFHMQKTNYNSNSQVSLMQDIYAEDYQTAVDLGIEERLKQIESEIMTPEIARRAARVSSVRRQVRDEAILKGRAEDLENFSKIKTSSEAAEEARKRAQLSMQEFQEVSQRATGFDRALGGFIGGAGGSLQDPITVASLFVGAGASRSILNAVAIESAVNAGAEALMQPSIAAWQKELGQEYGLSDAAINVISAGALGGTFAAIIKGAKPAAHFALESAANSKILPKKARTAAKNMANFVHAKEANTAPKVSKIDDESHFKNIEVTAKAMEDGRPVTSEEIYVGAVNPIDNTGKGFFDDSTVLTKQEIQAYQSEQSREIEVIKTELQNDAKNYLTKQDKKALRKELRETVKARQKAESINPRDKNEAAKQESAVKGLLEKESAIKDALRQADVSAAAKSDLDRLSQGVIPQRFKPRVDQAYNRVIANRASTKSPEIKRAQQEILEEQGVTEQDFIEPSAYDRLIEEAGSEEIFKAADAEFKRILKDNPELKITDEDGNSISIKELSEELREDEKVLKQITNCAIG